MISLRLVSVVICVVLTLATAVLTLAVTLSFTQKAMDDLGQRYSTSLAINLQNVVESHYQNAASQYYGLSRLTEQAAQGPPNTTWTPGWNGSFWTFNASDLSSVDGYLKSLTAVMISHNFTRETIAQMCFVDGTQLQIFGGNRNTTQWNAWIRAGKGPVRISAASPTFTVQRGIGFRQQVVTSTPTVVTHPTPWNMPFCTALQACAIIDCRDEPQYLDGNVYGRAQCWWLTPFVSTFTSALTGVFCTMYNSQNMRLGLTGSIMTLDTVSVFISRIERTSNAHAFAVDATNWGLVGSSFVTPIQRSWRWSNATFDEATRAFRNSSRFPMTFRPMGRTTEAFVNVGAVSANATYAVAKPSCMVSPTLVVCQRTVADYGYEPLLALQEQVGLTPSLGFRQGILHAPKGRYYYAMDGIATRASTYILPGLRWTVAVLTPDSDVLEKVVVGRTYSIVATTVFFVFAAICCYVLFTIFMRPLQELDDKMLMTANLADEKDKDEPLSKLTEVRNMQRSFYKLRTQLRRLKSFVPQSVLAAMDDDDDDGDGDDGSARPSTNGARSVVVEDVGTTRSAQQPDDRSSHTPSSKGRSTHKSSTHYTVSSGGQAVRLLNLQGGLVKKIVSVLELNMFGVHSQTKSMAPEEFARAHSKLLDHFHVIVTQEKGIVDGFQGDRFVATFNAVTNNAQHAVRACVAAQQITAGVSKLRLPFARAGVGIASGEALVGNAGTDSLRRFCTVGRVFTQATVMERLTKQHPTADVIISTGTMNQVRHEFYFEALDVVSFEGSSKPALVFALRNRMTHAMEEWNYAMLQNETKDRYSALNDAFAKFADGDPTASAALLTAVAEGDRELKGYQRLQSLLQSSTSLEGAVAGQGRFFATCFGPS